MMADFLYLELDAEEQEALRGIARLYLQVVENRPDLLHSVERTALCERIMEETK